MLVWSIEPNIDHVAHVVWSVWFFFFNDTATTEIYTLSLHDALPIFFHKLRRLRPDLGQLLAHLGAQVLVDLQDLQLRLDRKSTRLNSSHANISYAVFCLKKKKPMQTSSRDASVPDRRSSIPSPLLSA